MLPIIPVQFCLLSVLLTSGCDLLPSGTIPLPPSGGDDRAISCPWPFKFDLSCSTYTTEFGQLIYDMLYGHTFAHNCVPTQTKRFHPLSPCCVCLRVSLRDQLGYQFPLFALFRFWSLSRFLSKSIIHSLFCYICSLPSDVMYLQRCVIYWHKYLRRDFHRSKLTHHHRAPRHNDACASFAFAQWRKTKT